MTTPDYPQTQWRQSPDGGWEYLASDGCWYAASPPQAMTPYTPNNLPTNQTGNGQAVASLVLGITCIIFSWWGLFTLAQIVLAVIFGAVGISKAHRGAQGRGMAIAGLTLGCVGLLLYLIFGLVSLGVGFII